MGYRTYQPHPELPGRQIEIRDLDAQEVPDAKKTVGEIPPGYLPVCRLVEREGKWAMVTQLEKVAAPAIAPAGTTAGAGGLPLNLEDKSLEELQTIAGKMGLTPPVIESVPELILWMKEQLAKKASKQGAGKGAGK